MKEGRVLYTVAGHMTRFNLTTVKDRTAVEVRRVRVCAEGARLFHTEEVLSNEE